MMGNPVFIVIYITIHDDHETMFCHVCQKQIRFD